jgi:hypothetical protein
MKLVDYFVNLSLILRILILNEFIDPFQIILRAISLIEPHEKMALVIFRNKIKKLEIYVPTVHIKFPS